MSKARPDVTVRGRKPRQKASQWAYTPPYHVEAGTGRVYVVLTPSMVSQRLDEWERDRREQTTWATRWWRNYS